MDLNEILIVLGKAAGLIILGITIFYGYTEYRSSKERKDDKIKILFSKHPNFRELYLDFRKRTSYKPTYGNYRNKSSDISVFDSLIASGYPRNKVEEFKKNMYEELKEIEKIPSERIRIAEIIKIEYQYLNKKEIVKNYLRSKIERNEILYQTFVKNLEKKKPSLNDNLILLELKNEFKLNDSEAKIEFEYIMDQNTGLVRKIKDDEYFFPWGNIKYEKIERESRKIIYEKLGFDLSI